MFRSDILQVNRGSTLVEVGLIGPLGLSINYDTGVA